MEDLNAYYRFLMRFRMGFFFTSTFCTSYSLHFASLILHMSMLFPISIYDMFDSQKQPIKKAFVFGGDIQRGCMRRLPLNSTSLKTHHRGGNYDQSEPSEVRKKTE
jgi:hypothetical protein